MCMCYFKPEFAQIFIEKKLGPLLVIFPLKKIKILISHKIIFANPHYVKIIAIGGSQ